MPGPMYYMKAGLPAPSGALIFSGIITDHESTEISFPGENGSCEMYGIISPLTRTHPSPKHQLATPGSIRGQGLGHRHH